MHAPRLRSNFFIPMRVKKGPRISQYDVQNERVLSARERKIRARRIFGSRGIDLTDQSNRESDLPFVISDHVFAASRAICAVNSSTPSSQGEPIQLEIVRIGALSPAVRSYIRSVIIPLPVPLHAPSTPTVLVVRKADIAQYPSSTLRNDEFKICADTSLPSYPPNAGLVFVDASAAATTPQAWLLRADLIAPFRSPGDALSARIKRARNGTMIKCTKAEKLTIRVGTVGCTAKQLTANVVAVAEHIASTMPKLWRKVRALQITAPSVPPLRVFSRRWARQATDSIAAETSLHPSESRPTETAFDAELLGLSLLPNDNGDGDV